MSAPLQHRFRAINPAVFCRLWLAPLETDPAKIGTKRWAAGMPLPYRLIAPITGPITDDGSTPLVRVHTFGETDTLARQAADRTDSRVQVLVDNPGWGVTMPDGRTVKCDWAEIPAMSHEEPYAASSVVVRMVSEYRFGFTLVAA